MKPFSSYVASNVMTSNVLTVYEGWSIQRLARFFLEHRIAGAPVIASDHELVGVVSVSDIFRFENMEEGDKRSALEVCYRDLAGGQEINRTDLEAWAQNAQQFCTVHQIMTPEVISVAGDLPLPEVARTMVINDIHRIFVTIAGKIQGVITSSNMLAVMADQLSVDVA